MKHIKAYKRFIVIQLTDLFKFSLILLIFLIGFGVALQALLQPRENFTFSLFLEILDIAYWPLYGEIKILDDLKEKISIFHGLPVLRYVSSYFILIIYVALVSILLMNILIAIVKYNLKKTS